MKNKTALCGTRSGHHRHLKLKEESCSQCREAQREYDRQRFYKNPELKRERNKKHVNLTKKREAWRRRDALLRGVKTEKYSEDQVLLKYGKNCHICHFPINMSAPRRSGMGIGWEYGLNIDHVIPISMGGNDTIENVRPAHVLCNIRKGSRID